jgi:hypothetical protein
MGGKKGRYRAFPIREQPMEMEPCRLDVRAWPVLDLASDVTGDAAYRQMVDAMAEGFAHKGFDPASGLGYLGVQVEYDVIHQQPVPVSSYAEPTFKPSFDVPLARLWDVAPDKMARMMKSAYYGLITRPETMDFNRYCSYGFDGAAKKPSMAFSSRHVAFAQTGSMLIHWWGDAFVRTGDREYLTWAQKMADKWQAGMNPTTGLIVHWYGSQEQGEPTQPPNLFSNSGDSKTGLEFLRAGAALRASPASAALAGQVSSMGLCLLRGLARYGYLADERLFPQWIDLDGRARRETTFYTFGSQAEKDEAVRQDPTLADVAVYVGSGFYHSGPWVMGIQNSFPHDVALGAALTDDPELIERTRQMATHAHAEASKLTSGLTAENQWTYPASAAYVKTLLVLHTLTGNHTYLEWAREIADRELAYLAQARPAGVPEWWRQPFRNELIEATLLLHRALS